MGSSFKAGDHVEVWSNGQQAWVKDALVVEVLAKSRVIDGYTLEAGSVKVAYGRPEATKWIVPSNLGPETIRKVSSSAGGYAVAGTLSSASAGVAAPICKWGCGRQVQPGLTRGLKPFDTCCKRCALSKGAGDHDENCGGARPVMGASKTKSAAAEPKEWVELMCQIEAKLNGHASNVYKKACSGKALTREELRQAIALLCEPIGESLRVSEAALERWMGRGGVDETQFRAIANDILEDRRRAWFPARLPTKASMFVRRNRQHVWSVYKKGELLGEGSFGQVYRVTHTISGEQRVGKMIATSKASAVMSLDEIMTEIQNMAMLDHPNLIKVYEYFQDEAAVTQILEPCNGGELQDRIDAVFRKGQQPYTEEFVCDVMKQTLRALAFMHTERYMHKDLKPQNIMMVDKDSSSIKVIDFGLAELFKKDQKVSRNVGGTLLYMAPEVFREELSMKADVWSAGVILYNLLTGTYPYIAQWPPPPGRDQAWWEGETAAIIMDEEEHYKAPPGHIREGKLCRDLLALMLTRNPEGRPSAAECLEHAWFRQFEQEPPPLSVGVTQCLEAYAVQPVLKQSIFLLIAQQCTAPALQELRSIFTHFDFDNRGALDTASLQKVLERSGMSALQVARILHSLDKDESGFVEWTEFIAAAMCISVCRDERLVDAAFAVFDRDQDGMVTKEDLLVGFLHCDIGDTRSDDQRATWEKHLPDELKLLADGGDEKKFSKQQFRNYVGRRMATTSGDALSAVK
eukprot:TRINITY_DN11411_c0_g7_i1.p1 TRINITY_DN11411_c0_g7~~TRINITY_DN11411_c0_g7_i1.p1  ORF type:complete len:745 (+),score=202.17 TRINITY_DN11411_c0_g7_i1:107-2341(+)